MLMQIRGLQVELEAVRKIIAMRMNGKDTSQYDEEVKRYMKIIIATIHTMGKEAKAALYAELRRLDEAVEQARARLGNGK